jgi:hypothetical protein
MVAPTIESYPAFRAAQLNWALLTRDPDFDNDIKRATDEMKAKVGKAFDAVVDAAVRWQKYVLTTTGKTVRAEKSIGPQLAKMLGWVLYKYFPQGDGYPEGKFPLYDPALGREVEKNLEIPCWAEEHEEYAHRTGGLQIFHYFLLDMTLATKERMRLLLAGKNASKVTFVAAFRDFENWLKERRARGYQLHGEILDLMRSEGRMIGEGFQTSGRRIVGSQKDRGVWRGDRMSAAQLRRAAYRQLPALPAAGDMEAGEDES